MTGEHLADMARLCFESRGKVGAVSTTEQVTHGEAALIRRLIPALADRYVLRVECREEGSLLTVTFRRRTPA